MGVGTLKRAVFLDRDGVLNRAVVREGKPYPPASAGEMEIVEDAPEALRLLKQAGFELLVVTNQPDVARGRQTREAVEEIHRVLQSWMPVDGFYTCWHDDRDGCHCRKPKPGLIEQAALERGIDTKESFLVGDRWRDIGAGRAAGLACVFIDYGYAEALASRPDAVVRSLSEAADWILRESAKRKGERGGQC